MFFNVMFLAATTAASVQTENDNDGTAKSLFSII